jgi:hypothetical protein
MIDIKYTSSRGTVIDFRADNSLIHSANFHAWKWKPDTTSQQYGAKVNTWSKDAASYSIQLYIYGSLAERRALLDMAHDEFENDIINNSPGRLTWGDYYIDCFISESSVEPLETDMFTSNKVNIYCPYSFWIKELSKSFEKPSEQSTNVSGLNYPYNYPYDYASDIQSDTIENEHIKPANFKMIIYGPCTNPMVQINGHTYQVLTSVGPGEYLVIDTRPSRRYLPNLCIYRVNVNGTKINEFNNRYKEESIFEPIPSGRNIVTWNKSFGFDLTLYMERSEPSWT